MDARLDVLKTASKKIVHKTRAFLVNKIVNAVTKSNDNKIEKQEPAEEINFPLEKGDEIINDLGEVLI